MSPPRKPSLEMMKATYEALPHRTVRKLAAALVVKGFKASAGSCQRAIATGFKPPANEKPTRAERGDVKGVHPDVKEAESLVGQPLRTDEIGQLEADLAECRRISLAQLREIQERERLTTNILLMRCMQRKADRLVLIPRDVAVLVGAMTEAERPALTQTQPDAPYGPYANGHGHGNGHGNGLIDVTPSKPINEVADAIGKFLKAEGVAA